MLNEENSSGNWLMYLKKKALQHMATGKYTSTCSLLDARPSEEALLVAVVVLEWHALLTCASCFDAFFCCRAFARRFLNQTYKSALRRQSSCSIFCRFDIQHLYGANTATLIDAVLVNMTRRASTNNYKMLS